MTDDTMLELMKSAIARIEQDDERHRQEEAERAGQAKAFLESLPEGKRSGQAVLGLAWIIANGFVIHPSDKAALEAALAKEIA